MLLNGYIRDMSSKELEWCVANLTDYWSQKLIKIRNYTLMRPDDKDGKDDLKLMLHSWRRDQNYPFRKVMNVDQRGKPNP